MTDLRVLPRAQFGNPILREKAKRVSHYRTQSDDFKELIRLMFYTMRRVAGVGLAAPQIGESIQLAVIALREHPARPDIIPIPKTVLINPRIIDTSDELVSDWESCLSFPGVLGLVPRHQSITVEYMNDKGELQTAIHYGFTARVFQHEIDHLKGTVYVDKMPDMRNLITQREFRDRII